MLCVYTTAANKMVHRASQAAFQGVLTVISHNNNNSIGRFGAPHRIKFVYGIAPQLREVDLTVRLSGQNDTGGREHHDPGTIHAEPQTQIVRDILALVFVAHRNVCWWERRHSLRRVLQP
jgi:hypothetical protein